jgi:hypothetical protein
VIEGLGGLLLSYCMYSPPPVSAEAKAHAGCSVVPDHMYPHPMRRGGYTLNTLIDVLISLQECCDLDIEVSPLGILIGVLWMYFRTPVDNRLYFSDVHAVPVYYVTWCAYSFAFFSAFVQDLDCPNVLQT